MSQTRASPLCVLCDFVFQNDDATDNLLYRLLLAAAQEESPYHVSSLYAVPLQPHPSSLFPCVLGKPFGFGGLTCSDARRNFARTWGSACRFPAGPVQAPPQANGCHRLRDSCAAYTNVRGDLYLWRTAWCGVWPMKFFPWMLPRLC